MLIRCVMFFGALFATGCVTTPAPEPMTLTLLHINDHHSHLEGHELPLPATEVELAARTERNQPPSAVHAAYGGYPRLVALARTLSVEGEHTLKLHAGDAITGTPYFNEFAGRADAAMMNQFCFDAFVLGNHEFDNGDTGLAQFLDFLVEGDCPTDILSANVIPGPNSSLQRHALKPYAIYNVENDRVAVIGLTIAHKTRQSSSPDPDTRFLDEQETAQRHIDELLEQGINKIILLTHLQYANDLTLAQELRGVDLIVGGDSHSLLGASELSALGFAPDGPYPSRTSNRDGDTVCVVQAGDYSRALGHLTVEFDPFGRVTGCEGEPLLPLDPQLTYEYAPGDWRPLPTADRDAIQQSVAQWSHIRWVESDAEASSTLAPFREHLATLHNTILGRLDETLCQVRLPGEADCAEERSLPQGSPVATLVAQSFLKAVPDADIALQNAGGVRTHLYRGPVTRADLMTLLPFENALITLELTGAELNRTLEQAVDYALRPDGSTGAYPYAAGIRFNVNRDQPAGQRLSELEVNPGLATHWQPLEADRRYRIVVNQFIAQGGDGYRELADRETRHRNIGIHYARPLSDWLQQTQNEGRVLSGPDTGTFSTRNFK